MLMTKTNNKYFIGIIQYSYQHIRATPPNAQFPESQTHSCLFSAVTEKSSSPFRTVPLSVTRFPTAGSTVLASRNSRLTASAAATGSPYPLDLLSVLDSGSTIPAFSVGAEY